MRADPPRNAGGTSSANPIAYRRKARVSGVVSADTVRVDTMAAPTSMPVTAAAPIALA